MIHQEAAQGTQTGFCLMCCLWRQSSWKDVPSNPNTDLCLCMQCLLCWAFQSIAFLWSRNHEWCLPPPPLGGFWCLLIQFAFIPLELMVMHNNWILWINRSEESMWTKSLSGTRNHKGAPTMGHLHSGQACCHSAVVCLLSVHRIVRPIWLPDVDSGKN